MDTHFVPLTVHAMALASAALSAAATICIRQGLVQAHYYTGFWINLAVGVVGLWILVFLTVPLESLHLRAVVPFILSGLLGTAMGRLLRFVSIEKVGAPVAASLINLNPFIAAGLAIVFLGEQITWPILTGTLVIVLGTVLLSLTGKQVGFRAVHLAYPLLSASCFGTVAIIRKLGLAQIGPLLGATVNMTTAFVAFSAFLLVSGNRSTLPCTGHSLWYFIGAGVAENAGVLLAIVSLSHGHVSLVIPLTGTAPLFVLVLSAVFLRGVDRLNGRLILGALLIVLGVFLLTAKY